MGRHERLTGQLALFDDRLPFASGLPDVAPRGNPFAELADPWQWQDRPPPDRGPGQAPSFDDYLRSPRWLELRGEALERDGHRCRFCDSDHCLQVHHRRYPAVLGTETVDDLTTMCGRCHLILVWFRSQAAPRWRRLKRR